MGAGVYIFIEDEGIMLESISVILCSSRGHENTNHPVFQYYQWQCSLGLEPHEAPMNSAGTLQSNKLNQWWKLQMVNITILLATQNIIILHFPITFITTFVLSSQFRPPESKKKNRSVPRKPAKLKQIDRKIHHQHITTSIMRM